MGETAEGLVGRSRECAELTSVFDEAAAGRGGVVLVAGEPGIGKTSLALAFSDWASAHGGVVCWGRAWEAGGAPAFWPWIEVLRELAREPALLADLPGLPEIASLLPEIRDRFPGLGEVPAADPAPGVPGERSSLGREGRFRLFDAVSALLRRAAARAPLAIVLDDLHAADVPSLELLRFVARGARRSPIVIVGTYRDAEARLSEAAGLVLAKIEREARVLRPLRLGRDDVGLLVERTTGSAATEDLVSRLVGVTEGNPLFVVETLRLLRAQGTGGDSRTMPVAGGVREVIRERLAVLSDEVRAVVDAASVLGRDVDPALLAAATGLSPAELQGPLEVALAADVLTRRDDGRLLSFSHILLREVPYRALPGERRARLHSAVADALERRTGAGGPVPFAELALHAFEAASVGGLDRAIRWATQAAERAMSLFAFEDAVPLLERSLDGLRDVHQLAQPGDDVRRCDLLLALGEARIRAGLDRKGREACEEAAAIARRLGDTERLARAALDYGEVFTFAALDPTLTSLLEESLAALGPGDRPCTARLLARLASALQPARDPAPPMDLARDAIGMARRIGDDRCRLAVLHSAISALLYFAEPSERMELNAEQVALAGALGDKLRQARGHLRLVFDHLELGDVARADASILEYERIARELRLPAVAWHGPMMRAMRALLEGRFAEAEEREAEARELALQADDSNTTLTTTLFRAGLYWTAARHDELAAYEPTVRDVLERAADGPYFRACMAGIQARLGRTVETRAELARLATDLGIYDTRLMAAWVAEAVAFAGERPAAEHLYGSLAKLQHRNHSWGIASMVCDGPVSAVRGVLAARLERWDEAERCFEDALARTEAMGARPAGARTRLSWARALVHRGAGEDAPRARALVDEARRAADELDLPGLRGPLEELAASLAPVRASAPPPPERVSEPGAALPIPAEPTFSLTLEGEVWTITCGDKVFRLKDSKGLQILSQLVTHSGREFHVTDLVAPAGEAGHLEDAGEVLDREAAAQYRQRAKDLQDELREAEGWGDAGRVARLREELDFLASELSRGLGLGGRSRKASSSAEKARVNVQRRLKDAIQRITEQRAALGQHLERAVKTGTFCSYG
jgi:hypothetical protein